jgi:hypothetical protein
VLNITLATKPNCGKTLKLKIGFIQKNSMDSIEYQGISESLCWLREELRYGNNLIDDVIVVKLMTKMGNPHPSSG